MIKKVLTTVVATAALSVPLAGVAGADPAPNNPGVPGTLGGVTPGSGISTIARAGESPGKAGLGQQKGFSTVGPQGK
jgi:hypothetical protein